MDQETKKGYAWEEEYKRSWDTLKEEKGHLKVTSLQTPFIKKTLPIKRGILSRLIIVIDCSKSMENTDFKPTRLELTFQLLNDFIFEFFDQNPLSLITILICQDALCSRETMWFNNYDEYKQKINTEIIPSGEFSLVNSLEQSLLLLKYQ
jgi:transcription initiation factor TFIIH subunit 2